nr:sodium-dependent neutral amino acid transporter B(0)AT3 [Leptinotarsa decemlineata]
MSGKTLPEMTRNGHELAPLTSRNGSESRGKPGVTIVLQGPRGSIISRGSGAMEQDPDRAAWSGKLQFFLSIIGYSVGLGNIWRFPYLCQQNGGGAFLIPFAVMLVLEGIPLFLIELGIGQKMRLGSLGVWNTIHPWLGGIGISSCIVTFFVALYYNVIITWCFYYLFNSFQYPLPWESCPLDKNGSLNIECDKSSATAYHRTEIANKVFRTFGSAEITPTPDLRPDTSTAVVSMAEKKIRKKVVYFTSVFPYLVLTIFFIRGITLKGAAAGLEHMLTPKVEKLLMPKVWLDAATQVFYSFGLAFGSLIAFGSYNTPKNNCVRDVILVSVCNAVTAIYASVVIFAILGFKAVSNVDKCRIDNINLLMKHDFLAKSLLPSQISEDTYQHALLHANNTIDIRECSLDRELDAAAEGTGLAFIVFTQAIVELPGAPFWAVIFFMMLLSLGIGSQIGILEGMLCTVFDIEILKRVGKQYITAVVCIICFSMGLIFTTGAGEYWLSMFDSFAGTIGLVVVAFLEMIAVIYVYGHEKFTKDIYEMTGVKPGLYWQITWRFLAPVIMVLILLSSIVSMVIDHPKYQAWNKEQGDVVATPYPSWVMGIAIAMILAGILPIPIVFLLRRYQILKLDVNIHEGSIRRIDTTVSTKEMITDVDPYEDDDIAGSLGPYHDSDSDDEGPQLNIPCGRKVRMEVVNDY